MAGRHAAPGYSGLFRELAIFLLKVVFWGAIIFGAVLLFQMVFSSDDDPTTTTTQSTTATTSAPTVTTEATTITVAPTTTTIATTTTAAATTTTLAGRDPSEVTVLVLNSTTRGGIAADLSDALGEVGYQTLESDNWGTPFSVSRIWYVVGYETEARVIARYVSPDAIVELFQGVTQADIIIVLGASYGG
ncbi:MAG: LytR C-terminal domain-containing protein [Acidimicrobiia bacterium]|nr:LytR C-terminal domain-containing protein [Acidimicrobiia bacterium]